MTQVQKDVFINYNLVAQPYTYKRTAVIYSVGPNMEPREVCSGVFAKHNDVYFIITCGHAFHLTPDNYRVCKNLYHTNAQDLIIPARIEPIYQDNADVGIVFLNPADVVGIEDRFTNLMDLVLTQPRPNDEVLVVSGYPVELLSANEQTGIVTSVAIAYQTIEFQHANPPNNERIYLDYPADNNFLILEDDPGVDIGDTLPHPGGMSGGGIWRLNVNKTKGEIWSAEADIKLVAIQIAWVPGSRYLIGQNIQIWLDRFLHLI